MRPSPVGDRRRPSRLASGATLATLALFVLAGCASTGGSSTSIRGMTITAEDLLDTSYSDVFEVLDQHRMVVFRGDQMFYSGRGASSFNREVPMLVVLDGAPLGNSASSLSGITLDDLERIDILRPTQAAPRFGSRAGGGAVVVTTK